MRDEVPEKKRQTETNGVAVSTAFKVM